jgi:hypothetical protein
MSSNGQVVAGMSAVVSNDGKVLQVPDLAVPTNRIFNFVALYRKDYFEDHSLDWCLDEIISRGIAEITRQVKTAKKVAVDKASGSLLKEFNLSPADAKKLLLDMLAKQKAEADAALAKANAPAVVQAKAKS